MSEFGPSDKEIAKEADLQRRAGDAAQIVWTRYAIWAVTASLPIAAMLSGYAGNRIMTAIDKVIERQATAGETIVKIQGDVAALKGVQDVFAKATGDRVDETNRLFNSRLDAQGKWIQRLADNLDDLIKKVYALRP